MQTLFRAIWLKVIHVILIYIPTLSFLLPLSTTKKVVLNCLVDPEFRIIKLHIKSCECSFKELGNTKCYLNVSFNYSIDIIRFPR